MESDWTVLTDSLSVASLDRGATAGIERPNGGGNFVYGFNSLEVISGAAGLFTNGVGFAPMASGGTVRGAIQRGPSGGVSGFAPMLFIGLQGPSVNDLGYILGLSDGDPHRIALVKGRIVDGVPDLAPDPDGNTVLMRSTESYAPGTWLHLRLDMIVQGTGDVLLQCYANDLDANPVTAPLWAVIPGMEGPLYPAITGFVDDALAVNTGSAPYTSGRGGFAFACEDVTRRGFFDHLQVGRQ